MEDKIKLDITLTDREAKLVHTFIRRSIFEQYERNMTECGFSYQENQDRIYDTIGAFNAIQTAIEEKMAKRKNNT